MIKKKDSVADKQQNKTLNSVKVSWKSFSLLI